MVERRFAVPVLVVSGAGIEAIETLDEAVRFLERWPAPRRGPVHQCAMKACEAAIAGHLTVEEGRRSLASFARITGILAAGRARPAAGRSGMALPRGA